ncbi:MAG: hypothetical protein ACM3JD_11900 [Rudaea sp.]
MATLLNALILALADLVIIYLLVRGQSPARFRALKWQIAAGALLFWSVLSAVLLWGFWDIYYRNFYGDWTRWAFPIAGVGYALAALLFWWLAQRLPGNPFVTFCLLGGLESIPEHLFGIYYLGILQLPVLQGETTPSILGFAIFEYILYWSVVLGLGLIIQSLTIKRAALSTGHAPGQRGET